MNLAGVAYDREAEEALLATALVEPDQLADLAMRVRPTDFSPLSRYVWLAALELFEQGGEVNQVSVAYELSQRGTLDEIGGQTYLADVIRRSIVSPDAALFYASAVRQVAVARDVMLATHAVQALVRENPADAQRAIDRGIELLQAAAGENVEQSTRTAEQVMADGLWQRIEERMKNPKAIQGLQTGWPRFDAAMDGLVRRRVYMYGAETSMGKSLFAHDLIRRVAAAGHPVLIFTTEMAAEEVADRMIYQIAGLNPETLKTYGYSTGDRARVEKAMADFQALPIVFCERGDLNFGYLRSEVRRVRAKYPALPLVVVDHIDMVSGVGQNRTAELQGITKGVKALAMDQDVAVLAVSHLNRQTDANRNAKTARFRDSESKQQDSNVGWIIQPVEQGEMGWQPMTADDARAAMGQHGGAFVRLEMTKNRHGRLQQLYFRIDWSLGGRFEEAS